MQLSPTVLEINLSLHRNLKSVVNSNFVVAVIFYSRYDITDQTAVADCEQRRVIHRTHGQRIWVAVSAVGRCYGRIFYRCIG